MSWEHGLSMLICDYVFEVCSDPRLTSADPVQSHLLDGRCVADWGRKALQRLSTRLHQVAPCSHTGFPIVSHDPVTEGLMRY